MKFKLLEILDCSLGFVIIEVIFINDNLLDIYYRWLTGKSPEYHLYANKLRLEDTHILILPTGSHKRYTKKEEIMIDVNDIGKEELFSNLYKNRLKYRGL